MFLSLCTDSEDNDIVIEEKMTVHVVSNATRFFVGVCMGMWTMCNDTLPKVKFKRSKEEDDDSHALFMTSMCEGCRRESWMKNLIYAPRPQEYAQLGICEKMTLSNNANQEATPMPREPFSNGSILYCMPLLPAHTVFGTTSLAIVASPWSHTVN